MPTRLVTRRPRAVLTAALGFLVLAGLFGGPVAGLLSTGDDFQDPGAESVAATQRLERAGGVEPSPTIVALVRSADRATAERVETRLAGVEGIARTGTSGRPGRAPALGSSRAGPHHAGAAVRHDRLGDPARQGARDDPASGLREEAEPTPA